MASPLVFLCVVFLFSVTASHAPCSRLRDRDPEARQRCIDHGRKRKLLNISGQFGGSRAVFGRSHRDAIFRDYREKAGGAETAAAVYERLVCDDFGLKMWVVFSKFRLLFMEIE